jgi:hypothetical protein
MSTTINRNAAALLAMLALATAALVAAQPARAARTPAHTMPIAYCNDGPEITVELPTSISSFYRSERVRIRYHLFRLVDGTWRRQARSGEYSNFATYGGALLGGWQPVGGDTVFGAQFHYFYPTQAGDYRVAMEIRWLRSGAYAYKWARQHVIDDAWNFRKIVQDRCRY